jgi:hypothetical protein
MYIKVTMYTCLCYQGADHLTVTWKVAEGVLHHIDIKEEGKENAFSLGSSLLIGGEVSLKLKLYTFILCFVKIFLRLFFTFNIVRVILYLCIDHFIGWGILFIFVYLSVCLGLTLVITVSVFKLEPSYLETTNCWTKASKWLFTFKVKF